MYFSNDIRKEIVLNKQSETIHVVITGDVTGSYPTDKLRVFEEWWCKSNTHITCYKLLRDIFEGGGVRYKNYYMYCPDKAYFSITYGSLCNDVYTDDMFFTGIKINNYRMVIQKLFGIQEELIDYSGYTPRYYSIADLLSKYKVGSVYETPQLLGFDNILILSLNSNEFYGDLDKVYHAMPRFNISLPRRKVMINNNVINFGLLKNDNNSYLPYMYDRNNKLIIFGVKYYIEPEARSINEQVNSIVHRFIYAFKDQNYTRFRLIIKLNKYMYKQIYNLNINKYMYSSNSNNLFLFDNYNKRNNSYVTRINLYDKYNNVLAVAKLSKPLNDMSNLSVII